MESVMPSGLAGKTFSFGVVVVSAYLHLRGDQWNGVGTQLGQSIAVTMVPSAGIPMPQPPWV